MSSASSLENEKRVEFLQPMAGSTMGSCGLVLSVDCLASAGDETEITWLILHGRLNNEANDLRRFPCCGVTGWSGFKKWEGGGQVTLPALRIDGVTRCQITVTFLPVRT